MIFTDLFCGQDLYVWYVILESEEQMNSCFVLQKAKQEG